MDMLKPKGEPVKMSIEFNTNLTHNIRTRMFIMCMKIMINITPSQWYSKRKATVKTSNFGFDVLFVRIAT